MASRRGRIIILVCIIALGASLWRMGTTERANRRLTDDYTKASELVEQLQAERTQLAERLGSAQQTVEGQATQIGSLQQELAGIDRQLKETLTELAALKREHDELRQNHASLGDQFNSLNQEKKQLEFRLSNLKELKQAIRQVKREVWNQRWAAWRERIRQQRLVDEERLASGNRGYMVRNGVSTVKAPHLQVHVLEPQPQ